MANTDVSEILATAGSIKTFRDIGNYLPMNKVSLPIRLSLRQ